MSGSPKISARQITLLKVFVHIVCAWYLSSTFYLAFTDNLGGDPVEAIIHFTGISAFNLILITLAVSPLAKRLKQPHLMKIRRMLGVWTFVYALVHLLCFIAFEIQFEWFLVVTEIIERPYITVGFAALLILTLLAITSFQHMQRKMGRNWQKLHNWIYPAAGLISLHYIWSVKSDYTQPAIYLLLLLALLTFRRNKFTRPYKKV